MSDDELRALATANIVLFRHMETDDGGEACFRGAVTSIWCDRFPQSLDFVAHVAITGAPRTVLPVRIGSRREGSEHYTASETVNVELSDAGTAVLNAERVVTLADEGRYLIVALVRDVVIAQTSIAVRYDVHPVLRN